MHKVSRLAIPIAHCTPAGTKKAWVALKKWRWQQNTPIFLHWKMYPELDFDVLSGIEFLGSWAWSVPVLTAESYGRLPAEELLSCCDASALFEKTSKQHSCKHTGRLSRLCLTKAASAQGRRLCNQTPGNALEWRVHFPTLLVLPFISDRRHDP